MPAHSVRPGDQLFKEKINLKWSLQNCGQVGLQGDEWGGAGSKPFLYIASFYIDKSLQASMKVLSESLQDLLHVPEYLVPLLDLFGMIYSLDSYRFFMFHELRVPILQLAERFESCHEWGLERAFTKWCFEQPMRSCLPKPFEFLDYSSF